MLAAFTHQIQELERKTELQNLQITELKNRLDSNQNRKVACDCTVKLDSLQAQIHNNNFKINDLTSKFDHLQKHYDRDVFTGEVTDGSPFIEDSPSFSPSWKAPGSRGTTPNNQMQDSYDSNSMGSPVGYSAKEFFAAATFANASNTVNNLNTNNQMSGNKPSPWSFDNPKIKEPPQSQNPQGFQFGDQQQSEAQMPTQQGCKNSSTPITMENLAMIASENSHLKQQIVKYRQKVSEFDDVIKNRDCTIDDLRMIREHFLQKEREWIQKQEWYEHKLKLLKQDKRRRGETIGKLLKCIDDMKDSGRLDESRVKDGRAVLSATLYSRGLHPEERVVRVVDAVEYDRVPRTPHESHSNEDNSFSEGGGSKVADTSGSGNENKNNSSRSNRNKPGSLDLRPVSRLDSSLAKSLDLRPVSRVDSGLAKSLDLRPVSRVDSGLANMSREGAASAEYLAQKFGFIPIKEMYDCKDVEMQLQ